jgi:hypothetical protein
MKKTIFHLSASICIALASFCPLHADEPLLPAEEEPLGRVLAIAQKIEEPRDRLQTLLRVATAYIECKDLDAAKHLLSKVVQGAMRIEDANFKAMLLAELADRYISINENDTALDIARHIPFLDSWSDAMVRIIDGYIRQGQYQKALRLVKNIAEPFPKALALCTVIKSARGRYPNVVHEAENIMRHSSTETRNLVRVISIGELARFDSKPVAHFSVTEDLSERYKKLLLLAEKCTAAQSHEQVKRILTLATHIVKDIKSPLFRNAVLSRIAIIYAKIHEFEKALALTRELDADDIKAGALSQIIINYKKAEKEQEALLLLASTKPPLLKNRVCCLVTYEYARNAELDKALEAAKMIKDKAMQLDAMLAVAKNMQGRNDIPLETKELFNQALSLLNEL